VDYQQLASLGFVILLVGSLTGVGVATTHSMESDSQSKTEIRGDRGADALQRGPGVNLSEVNVTALEAAQLAQNQTGGKAVVVSLGSQNETPVFNVSVLHENLTVAQATIDATDRTVRSVRPNVTVVERSFLGGEAFDYAELRTVGDAIRLVENRTNGTVVNAGIRRGQLVYAVALRTQEGSRTSALVAATDEPLLGIRTVNRTASPTNTTTES
jgi:uncharacterized membrane protein YkoI